MGWGEPEVACKILDDVPGGRFKQLEVVYDTGSSSRIAFDALFIVQLREAQSILKAFAQFRSHRRFIPATYRSPSC